MTTHPKQASNVRKLSVIMFTDIYGYTKLMGRDQDKALEVLRINRSIHKQAINKHNGRWVKEMGDGVLAQFSSARDAVFCALEIQEKANHELESKLRIGVHLGDVTEEENDIFGDGVNIASRLQELADPGGIYVSDSILQAIKSTKGILYGHIGPVQLKNVNDPVNIYFLKATYLQHPSSKKISTLNESNRNVNFKLVITLFLFVFVVGVLSWYFIKNEKIKFIAVIPFDNISQDSTQDLFVNGMTDALRANLGKVSALKVIWNKSTSWFEKSEMSFTEIGKELGVDALVTGSILKMGNSVTVNAQLVRTKNQELIWGESFTKNVSNALKLQSEIAQNIVDEIQILITPEEAKILRHSPEVDPRTLELIFKGLAHLYKLDPDHYDIALDYFNQVLVIDSLNSEAYAGMGLVWIHKGQWGREDPVTAAQNARIAASKALAIDPDLPMAHMAMAHYYTAYDWDWEKAAQEYQNTIAINGSLSEPRAFYADLLVSLGEFDEAFDQVEAALKVDPLNPTIHMLVGWTLLASRKYDLAIQSLNRSLELEPNLSLSHRCLWTIYHQRQNYDLAMQHAVAFYKNQNFGEIASCLDSIYQESGVIKALKSGADQFAANYENHKFSAMRIARLYTFSGDRQNALKWLEQAYNERYVSFSSLNVDPHWESLHEEPRFKDLVGKMNLSIPTNY